MKKLKSLSLALACLALAWLGTRIKNRGLRVSGPKVSPYGGKMMVHGEAWWTPWRAVSGLWAICLTPLFYRMVAFQHFNIFLLKLCLWCFYMRQTISSVIRIDLRSSYSSCVALWLRLQLFPDFTGSKRGMVFLQSRLSYVKSQSI